MGRGAADDPTRPPGGASWTGRRLRRTPRRPRWTRGKTARPAMGTASGLTGLGMWEVKDRWKLETVLAFLSASTVMNQVSFSLMPWSVASISSSVGEKVQPRRSRRARAWAGVMGQGWSAQARIAVTPVVTGTTRKTLPFDRVVRWGKSSPGSAVVWLCDPRLYGFMLSV